MRKMAFNIIKLKSFIFMSIVILGLSVPTIRVQATDQTQGSEAGQTSLDREEPVTTGVEITTTTMMYAVKKVNVRKEPNTSSEILGDLEPGENIFAVELTEEGWYRVVYAGETGYIRGDFLAVFGNSDEWAVSEPEPVPIEEPDITEEAEGDNNDAQPVDDDGAAENAESEKEVSDGAAEQEEQPAGKINIFTILIVVVLIIVIFVYAAIQIVNDYKNPDGDQEDDEDGPDGDDEWEDDEAGSDEDDEWVGDETEPYGDGEWNGDENGDEYGEWEDDEPDKNSQEEETDFEVIDLDSE